MDPKSVFSFDYVTKEELEKEIRLVNESKALQEKKSRQTKICLVRLLTVAFFHIHFKKVDVKPIFKNNSLSIRNVLIFYLILHCLRANFGSLSRG